MPKATMKVLDIWKEELELCWFHLTMVEDTSVGHRQPECFKKTIKNHAEIDLYLFSFRILQPKLLQDCLDNKTCRLKKCCWTKVAAPREHKIFRVNSPCFLGCVSGQVRQVSMPSSFFNSQGQIKGTSFFKETTWQHLYQHLLPNFEETDVICWCDLNQVAPQMEVHVMMELNDKNFASVEEHL